jgi:octaprenyl-diphosphate synthase
MIGNRPHSPIEQIVAQFVREELSAENAHIAGAIWSMLDAGGKRLRPRIVMLAGRACSAAVQPDAVLASYMELIHVATLIHDDVLDGAELRRGKTSTRHAYGNRFSVLAGDYLFAWVFKKVTQAYASPVPTILAAMLSDICNGEVKQLRAAGDLELSKERYLEIIGKKTAELFAACSECGAIVALQAAAGAGGLPLRELSAVKALREYGWHYGLAFQIRDDLLDITASDVVLGKPAAADLRERKVTLPLIYALQDANARVRPLAAALFALEDGAQSQAAAMIETLVTHVRASQAIDKAVQTMSEYAARAKAALATLPASDARDELGALADSLSGFSP